MERAGRDTPVTTRRAVLGGIAGTAAVGSVPLAAADSNGIRVATRNLYVGVDLFELALAEDLEDVRRIAGDLLAEARAHPYEARAEALAAEVAATEPDVIGVQEAALLRTREPSAFDGEHDPGAEDVLVDLLATYRDAIADRGLEYEVAATTVTNDVEVPAATDDGDVDVRITDRVAVLVREDVAVEDVRTGTFEAALPVPIGETQLAISRGFCSVDVPVGEETATVATTHLESFDSGTRQEQARELLERLPTDRPVVLAGDVNSGPDGQSDAYDLLTESFTDPVDAVSPGTDQKTCCFDADLRGDVDDLSVRVDHVLSRGDLSPTEVRWIGVDPEARATVEADGETVRLWPSDHAGVVADFELGAQVEAGTTAATATRTPSRTEASTGTDAEPADRQSESQSGFGLLAVAGATAVVTLARRLRRTA